MEKSSDVIEERHDQLAVEILRTRRGRLRGGVAEPGLLRRRWSSRQLHQLGLAVSHSWAGVVAFGAALAWICVGLVLALTPTGR